MNIGITGHQDIGTADDIAWVTEQLRALIAKQTDIAGITSLAVGADQLFATLLVEQRKPFTVIVPCENYEETFSTSEDLARYTALLKQASDVMRLPYDQPGEKAYWEAGKRVAASADVIAAVWNGLPAKGLGGTADVVRYCQEIGKKVLHFNPRTHEVVAIWPPQAVL